MLEEAIKELTSAVRDLIAQLKGSTPAVTVTTETPGSPETPAADPKAAAKAAKEAEKAAAKAAKDAEKAAAKAAKDAEKAAAKTQGEANLKSVQEVGMKLIKAGKQAEVKAVLAKVGATTFTAIKAESMATVLAELQALENAPEGSADTPATTAEVSLDDVLAVAKPLLETNPDKSPKHPKAVEAIKGLLKEFGAAKVSAVDAAKRGEFLAKLKAIPADGAEESLV